MNIKLLFIFFGFFSFANNTIGQNEIPIHTDAALILPKTSGNLNVAIMNYTKLNQIEKLKKFEIGMQFPDSIQKCVSDFLTKNRPTNDGGLNPFLDWSIDLEATFIHKSSGTIETIDGFYYRNFQRNSTTNDWDDVSTNYPMRIRFAPKLAGEWSCFLTLKINKLQIANSLIIDFNVLENNEKGYVQVHPNHKNLQQNGEMIFPVGHNFPAPEEGVVMYHDQTDPDLPADMTNKAANVKCWKDYIDMVEEFLTSGGKYIRTIQAPWSSLIEFEEKGNYYNRLHYAWEQDNLIETCEKHDALIHFNLMMQEPFMNFGDYYFYDWDWGKYNYNGENVPNNPYPAYCYNDNPGVKQPHEMFLIEEDLKYHEQRTRYYVARYGYSTSIYAFELLSEPYHLDQFWQEKTELEPYFDKTHPNHAIIHRALNNYQNRMSDYLKNSLHTNQLVGVNSPVFSWLPTGAQLIDSSLFSNNVDIIGVNFYSVLPHKFLISKSSKSDNNNFDNSENSFARMIYYFQNTYNKPVILAEGGTNEDVLGCSDYKEFPVDMKALAMMGLAGYNGWNGYRNHETFLWESTVLIESQLPEILLPVLSELNGNWVQGRQKASLNKKDKTAILELQYYVSEGKNKSIGFVKNRSYNFFTKRTGESCDYADFQNGEESQYYPINELVDVSFEDLSRRNKLKIEGLTGKKEYTIKWKIDTRDIEQETIRTNRKGQFVLEFPSLNVKNTDNPLPIVWFTVE